MAAIFVLSYFTSKFPPYPKPEWWVPPVVTCLCIAMFAEFAMYGVLLVKRLRH